MTNLKQGQRLSYKDLEGYDIAFKRIESEDIETFNIPNMET